MKNVFLVLTFLVLITSCVSKQPIQIIFPDQEKVDARTPSGFFDFFKKKEPVVTLMKCVNCSTPYSEPNTVQLETAKSCAADRLYYQDKFKKIPNIYKLKRDNFPEANFPEGCVVHIMRSAGAYDTPSPYLTQCANEDSAPIRENDKIKPHKLACTTAEYAYSTYNAFVDVMDCLDVPQRELLPKIWNESQFHTNMYGKGDDAGVGQLTGDAIQEVIKQKYFDRDMTELDHFKAEMEKSGKASCNRILAEPSAWKIIGAKPATRCGIMTPEANPLRNILYTAVFYRVITARITGIYYRAGKEYIKTADGFIDRSENKNAPLGGRVKEYQLLEKMQSLGIQNPNMDFIKQVLVSLAFNSGSNQAVKIFDNFLKSKIANNLTITEADLDFINANSLRDKPLIDIPDGETEEAKAERETKLAEARDQAFDRNLPQFLRLMQNGGSPGYVSKIAFRTTKLNNEIGAGLCTQPSFLQHSLPQAQPQQ